MAQYKFTVLLMPNGPHRITGLPFETELYSSTHKITDSSVKVRLYFYLDFFCGLSLDQNSDRTFITLPERVKVSYEKRRILYFLTFEIC